MYCTPKPSETSTVKSWSRSWVVSCFFAQVWRLRRRVPRRVPSESSAVSSLRPPRAPPQEAVLLLVTWRRQPRLFLPALPRHLRSTERKKKKKALKQTLQPRSRCWKKTPDKSACFSDLCATLGQSLRRRTSLERPELLSYCDEQGDKKQNKTCIRLYRLQLHVSVLLSNVAHVLRLSSLYHTFPFTYCISYSRGKNVCEITAGASMFHAWALGGQSSRFSLKNVLIIKKTQINH